jgi:hypothetical protein
MTIENEGRGDGITGYYFNNENFKGRFEKRLDDNIDFFIE